MREAEARTADASVTEAVRGAALPLPGATLLRQSEQRAVLDPQRLAELNR